uniref:P-type domain-containing protein n=1 Tax=Marmota marmota marmota TaxID=9994 RepID=A0A8C5ZEN3_MARMA
MGHKVTCILLMVLMLGGLAHDLRLLLALPALVGKKCEMEVYERMNCGFPGVTADDCKKRDCCFADSPLGYPWCFDPRSGAAGWVLQSSECPGGRRQAVGTGPPWELLH